MARSLLTKKTASALGLTVDQLRVKLADGLDCRKCSMGNSVRVFAACRNDFHWLYCGVCGTGCSLSEYLKPRGDRPITGDTAEAKSMRVQQRMRKAVQLLTTRDGSLDTDAGLVTAAHIYSTRQENWDLAFRLQCIWQQSRLNLSRFVGRGEENIEQTALARRPYHHKFLPQSLVIPLQDYPGRHTGVLYLRYEAGVWHQVVTWFNDSRNGLCLLESLFREHPHNATRPWVCTDLVLGLQLAADYAKFFGQTMPLAILPFDLGHVQKHKERLKRLFSQLTLQPIVFGIEQEKTTRIAELCGLCSTAPITRELLTKPLPVLLSDLLVASTSPVV